LVHREEHGHYNNAAGTTTSTNNNTTSTTSTNNTSTNTTSTNNTSTNTTSTNTNSTDTASTTNNNSGGSNGRASPTGKRVAAIHHVHALVMEEVLMKHHAPKAAVVELIQEVWYFFIA
jgi:hypothetical protein